MTWDENDPSPIRQPTLRPGREIVDLDTLDDGRCKVSSWGERLPAKPTYENHFGPGGYNRCIGRADHVNPTHKDEWGHVFVKDDAGRRKVLRSEGPTNTYMAGCICPGPYTTDSTCPVHGKGKT